MPLIPLVRRTENDLDEHADCYDANRRRLAAYATENLLDPDAFDFIAKRPVEPACALSGDR